MARGRRGGQGRAPGAEAAPPADPAAAAARAVPASAFRDAVAAAAASRGSNLATRPSGPLDDGDVGGGAEESIHTPMLGSRLSSHRPSAGTRAAGRDELAGYADPEAPAAPGHAAGATARAVVVTLLSLQLGWGLWLLPSDYARLGWVPASCTIAIVALLTAYSATLFPRLIAAVDGAVLFGDVGAAAYGRTGRGLVYAFVYGLDATRCVILHLAASQALQHAAGVGAKALPRLGAVVALGAWALSQIRSLPHMSGFLAAGTTGQMFAIAVVLHTLITEPDRKASHAAFAWGEDPVKAAIAILNVFFAYGGQFAFTEIVVAMANPRRFAPAAAVATTIMTVAYTLLGCIGYASRGHNVHGVVIFALGSGPWERAAAAAVLVQAAAQYLVNLNVWCHNVLVLAHRQRARLRGGRSEADVAAAAAAGGDDTTPDAGPRVAADHSRLHWAVVTAAVVAYSYAISASLPYFSTLAGLMVAASYLVTAYVAPCAFALKLLPLSRLEAAWCRFLIVAMTLVSIGGLAMSIIALIENVGGGPAAAVARLVERGP